MGARQDFSRAAKSGCATNLNTPRAHLRTDRDDRADQADAAGPRCARRIDQVGIVYVARPRGFGEWRSGEWWSREWQDPTTYHPPLTAHYSPLTNTHLRPLRQILAHIRTQDGARGRRGLGREYQLRLPRRHLWPVQ